MVKRQLTILLFISLFFIVSVSGTTYQLVFADQFNNNIIDDTKWAVSNSSIPAEYWNVSETDRLYSGGNKTTNGTSNFHIYLSSVYNLNSNTSGYAEIQYQRLSIASDNAVFDFCFGNKVENFPINEWCGICFSDGAGDFYFHYPLTGGTLRLTPTISTGGDNSIHNIRIVATRNINSTGATISTLYQNYYDGVLINSQVQNASCKSPIINATITVYDTLFNSNMPLSAYSNFSLYSTGATNYKVRDVGDFCGKNASVCISGWCEYQFCALKPATISCEFNTECASGSCSYGYCAKFTLWEGIENSKDTFLGSDTGTGNIISIAVMIALAIAAASVSPMLAPFVFMVSAVFFTIVGWLSVFILFGIMLVGIIAGVFIIFLNSGG